MDGSRELELHRCLKRWALETGLLSWSIKSFPAPHIPFCSPISLLIVCENMFLYFSSYTVLKHVICLCLAACLQNLNQRKNLFTTWHVSLTLFYVYTPTRCNVHLNCTPGQSYGIGPTSSTTSSKTKQSRLLGIQTSFRLEASIISHSRSVSIWSINCPRDSILPPRVSW